MKRLKEERFKDWRLVAEQNLLMPLKDLVILVIRYQKAIRGFAPVSRHGIFANEFLLVIRPRQGHLLPVELVASAIELLFTRCL